MCSLELLLDPPMAIVTYNDIFQILAFQTMKTPLWEGEKVLPTVMAPPAGIEWLCSASAEHCETGKAEKAPASLSLEGSFLPRTLQMQKSSGGRKG